MADNNRLKRIGNSVLDAGTEDLEKMAVDATHAALQYVKDWVINLYQNRVKANNTAKANTLKLEDLERQIRISDETIKIGMDKKEIAVMWAMRKLGYTEEQTQQVLNLASEAYGKQE